MHNPKEYAMLLDKLVCCYKEAINNSIAHDYKREQFWMDEATNICNNYNFSKDVIAEAKEVAYTEAEAQLNIFNDDCDILIDDLVEILL